MSTSVDDTDPRFDYKDSLWQSSGESGDFMNTAHSTSTAGAQVIFGPFQGSSITIFGRVGADQPTMHYFVDGGSQSVDAKHPSTTGSTPLFQQQFYQAAGLDTTKNHTLQINQLDSGTFTLDFVVVGFTNNLIGGAGAGATTLTTSSEIEAGTLTPSTTPPAVNAEPLPNSSPSTSSPPTSPTNPSTSPNPLSTVGPHIPVSLTETSTSSPTSVTGPASQNPQSSTLSSSHGNNRLVVVGAVVGSVVFLGVALAFLLICLRRRRQLRLPNDSKTITHNSLLNPPFQNRPSLRLQIPNVFFWGSSKQNSSSAFLPTHKASASATSTNPSTITIGNNMKGNNSSRTLPPLPPPAFLFEDPNDSPIFDIKQRPVSGMTMTTRVTVGTVGTNVGHRVSEPDFSNYPLPDAPPLPDISIRERLENSRFGSKARLGGRQSPGMNTSFGQMTDSPEIPSFTNFNSSASATTSISIPATVLPFTLTSAGSIRSPPLSLDFNDLQLYGADENDVDRVVHRDAGVTLASNLPLSRRRREGRKRRIDLPPPYQDYD